MQSKYGRKRTYIPNEKRYLQIFKYNLEEGDPEKENEPRKLENNLDINKKCIIENSSKLKLINLPYENTFNLVLSPQDHSANQTIQKENQPSQDAYSAFIKNSPIENIRTPLGFYSSVRANEKRIKNNIPPIKYRRKYRVNYICI